jgi:hypothetical protein
MGAELRGNYGYLNGELAFGEKQGVEFGLEELPGRGDEANVSELTRCGELAGRCSKVVETIEKQLGFQGLVCPQPRAGHRSLRLP